MASYIGGHGFAREDVWHADYDKIDADLKAFSRYRLTWFIHGIVYDVPYNTGFFRRTIQKKLFLKYICTKKNRCKVNRLTRLQCQACRFAKCLNEGMVRDLVLNEKQRYAKRNLIAENRRRRIRNDCYWSENEVGSSSSILNDDPHQMSIPSAYAECYETQCGLELRHNDSSMEICRKVKSLPRHPETIHPLVKMFVFHIVRTSNFMKQIPGLNKINVQEKRNILKNCSLEIFLLHTSYTFRCHHPSTIDRLRVIETATQQDKRLGCLFQGLHLLASILFSQHFEKSEMAFLVAHLLTQTNGRNNLGRACILQLDSVRSRIETVMRQPRNVINPLVDRHSTLLIIANLVYVRYIALGITEKNFLFTLDFSNPRLSDFMKYFEI